MGTYSVPISGPFLLKHRRTFPFLGTKNVPISGTRNCNIFCKKCAQESPGFPRSPQEPPPPLPLPPVPTNHPPVSYLTSQTNPFELRAELVSSTLFACLVTYIGLLPLMPRPHTEVPYLHLVYGLMAGGAVVKCVATHIVYSAQP